MPHCVINRRHVPICLGQVIEILVAFHALQNLKAVAVDNLSQMQHYVGWDDHISTLVGDCRRNFLSKAMNEHGAVWAKGIIASAEKQYTG